MAQAHNTELAVLQRRVADLEEEKGSLKRRYEGRLAEEKSMRLSELQDKDRGRLTIEAQLKAQLTKAQREVEELAVEPRKLQMELEGEREAHRRQLQALGAQQDGAAGRRGGPQGDSRVRQLEDEFRRERAALQSHAERTAEHGRRARAQFSLRFLRSTDTRLLQLVLAAWRREAQLKRTAESSAALAARLAQEVERAEAERAGGEFVRERARRMKRRVAARFAFFHVQQAVSVCFQGWLSATREARALRDAESELHAALAATVTDDALRLEKLNARHEASKAKMVDNIFKRAWRGVSARVFEAWSRYTVQEVERR